MIIIKGLKCYSFDSVFDSLNKFQCYDHSLSSVLNLGSSQRDVSHLCVDLIDWRTSRVFICKNPSLIILISLILIECCHQELRRTCELLELFQYIKDLSPQDYDISTPGF